LWFFLASEEASSLVQKRTLFFITFRLKTKMATWTHLVNPELLFIESIGIAFHSWVHKATGLQPINKWLFERMWLFQNCFTPSLSVLHFTWFIFMIALHIHIANVTDCVSYNLWYWLLYIWLMWMFVFHMINIDCILKGLQ